MTLSPEHIQQVVGSSEAQEVPSITVAGGITIQEFLKKIEMPDGLKSITESLSPSQAQKIINDAKRIAEQKDYTEDDMPTFMMDGSF